ncbi:hypothetical protein EZV62_001396 [Acer yangbiense]|uniref:DUF8040 domain-containing protein n=1 Tax=Acer yangbiense TaxID=1000413 RepID=A0A5C7ITZ7_9ROSI|nr:hypothetical protein EZV62_001396 [Acer yangbiense]
MGLVMHYIAEYQYNKRLLSNHTFINPASRVDYINRLITYNDTECIAQLRMDRRTFVVLCELIRNTRRLKTDGLISIEEQVCMLLHILAHHVKNCTIRSRFYRSGETISRYFNSVLCTVLQLHNHLLVSPDLVPKSCSDKRWKWFKNCLGALDETYIKVHVLEVDKPRFRSSSDSRVLQDALSRPTGMKVPNVACCLLHNLIRKEMSIDPMEHELNEIIEDELDHDVIGQVSLSSE